MPISPARCVNTRAIVCTHASNLTGNALDASRIGAFAREHRLLFILDASQTAGNDLNAQRDGVSVLCFTGHKGMMGPQGTGGLIAAPGVEIRPLKTGGTGVQSYRRSSRRNIRRGSRAARSTATASRGCPRRWISSARSPPPPSTRMRPRL